MLPGGSDPENFDISQDGTTLFVSNEDAGTASVVDIASGKIRSTVKVGKEPEGVRVAPDGKTVWVTGETDHNVTVIDTKTGAVVGQVEVGKRPRSLAFTPDGARAYVTSEVDGTVWVLDAAARKSLKVIRMPEGSKPMGVGGRAGRATHLRVERPRRHGVGDRRGIRLAGRLRGGGDSGPGASRSRPTGGSSTRRTGRPTTSAWSMRTGSPS